jgi:hypothetical protein
MWRRALLCLLCMLLIGAGAPRPSTYTVLWSYPVGRVVDPADVVVTLHTPGSIVFKSLTNIGGMVRIRTPGRKACYTVSIVVPGAVYGFHDWTECPRTYLPDVSAP